MPECLLLDTPADVIDSTGGQLDDVERIQYAGGVLELVVDRVLVSLERVQRRDSHTLAEGRPACGEPVFVHGAGTSRDEIQQTCGSVPVAGEVDHAGEFLRSPPARIRVVPDVLIDVQDFDAIETSRVRGGVSQAGTYLGPQGVPGRAQLAGQSLDRGVLVPPTTRSHVRGRRRSRRIQGSR